MFDAYEGGSPSYIMGDIRIVPATRGACPVCGHPTGDCAGEQPAPERIVGDRIEAKPTTPVDVLVPENIYEVRQITPFTRARVLVAAKGTYVTAERAAELGIL